MCLFRRRKQDRIARDIAASHDMLPDYREAKLDSCEAAVTNIKGTK